GGSTDLSPSRHWPEPQLAGEVNHDHGPVLVTVEYRVDPSRLEEFNRAMQPMRLTRLRDGAIRWSLRSDAADPGRGIESFVVESWLEDLRQHERVTVADQLAQKEAWSLHVGPEGPVVSHYVAARGGH